MAKIYVAMSGGVDSSVSAALMKETGHEVVGAFIKTWSPDWMSCTWRDEWRDAARVAAHLDIPLLTLDLEEAYKTQVAGYMISEYREGKTPNPDVMCNKEIKFGAFLNWALSQDADFVATGHYARVTLSGPSSLQDTSESFNLNPHGGLRRSHDSGVSLRLLSGADSAKDQSYFLWTLTQEQLRHVVFPVGGMQKGEVRQKAEKLGLPVADKKDSQGLCFLGKIDMKEFLGHYIDTKEGAVLDEKGEVIGRHPGSLLFTLGERRGFVITEKSPEDKSMYVIAKDLEANTITVSESQFGDPEGSQVQMEHQLQGVNWISGEALNEEVTARIRYRGQLNECTVAGDTVTFRKPQLIASGQSVAFYQGEECLGGGVVV